MEPIAPSIVEAIKTVDEIPVPTTPLNFPRQKIASEISKNKEWEIYVANESDKLRSSALCELEKDVSDEQLLAKVREARGGIMALNAAYRFFRGCQNAVDAENRKLQ